MPRFQANFHLYAEDLERAISFYTENFKFQLLGRMDNKNGGTWATLKIENAIIWLGKEGTSTGLILLIDKEIEGFVAQLEENGIQFFIPENLKHESQMEESILLTSWGKHAWFIDSERNVVMLFEPIEG